MILDWLRQRSGIGKSLDAMSDDRGDASRATRADVSEEYGEEIAGVTRTLIDDDTKLYTPAKYRRNAPSALRSDSGADYRYEFAESLVADTPKRTTTRAKSLETKSSTSRSKASSPGSEDTPKATTRASGAKSAAKWNVSQADTKEDAASVGGGVAVAPMPITAGSRLTIKYNGLLSKSGAAKIYAHTGFGSTNWLNIRDIPMAKDPDGAWTAEIQLDPEQTSPLNVCFRDSAYNWDNNYGKNWSFQIHGGSNPLDH